MSRLILLYSGLFAVLVAWPSTSTAPVAETEWVESGNADSIPLLIRNLRSKEEVVQLTALAEFAGMPAKAKPAVPAILDALSDAKSIIRVEAAATLIHLNVRSQAAIQALRKELHTKDAKDRAHAAWTIGCLVKPQFLGTSCWGPDPPPRVARPWVGKRLLPALVKALVDPAAEVRLEVIQVLAVIVPEDKEARSALVKALRDEDETVRKAAAEALRNNAKQRHR